MDLNLKLEQACQSVLSGSSLTGSINLYTNLGNTVKEAPAVVIAAQESTEEFLYSNIYRTQVELQYFAIAEDTTYNAYTASCETILRAFADIESAKATMTGSVSDLGIYDLSVQSSQSETADDGWISTLTLEVVCALT